MRIMLDPGHGGSDPGAVNGETGMRESSLVLNYANSILDLLRAEKSHTVGMTRISDIFISLQDRVRRAREFNAQLFLSIHMNSAENPNAEGYEVWTSIGITKSDEYATIMFEEIGKQFPERKPRADWSDGDPDKEKNYHVLKETPMPAVLVELGFICNRREALWMADRRTIDLYSLAVVRGIREIGKRMA